MPVPRDARYECGCCGAQIVYRTACPREEVGHPRCVCGDEMTPLAETGGTQKA